MKTKKCKRCEQNKPKDAFRPNQWVCRACRNAERRENYRNNREHELARNERWKRENGPQWYFAQQRRKALERHQMMKDAAYEAYGGYVCACCGETERFFLTIDHIEGGGRQHRIAIKRVSITQWLYQNNFPPGFRVLCLNCNRGRYLNGGVCPHERARQDRECEEGAGI